MRITYDKIADALYIYFRKGKVKKTIKANKWILIDLDKKGNILGLEILSVSHQIPKKEIGKVYSEMPVYA
jgi:uncharacterized protein YuzE